MHGSDCPRAPFCHSSAQYCHSSAQSRHSSAELYLVWELHTRSRWAWRVPRWRRREAVGRSQWGGVDHSGGAVCWHQPRPGGGDRRRPHRFHRRLPPSPHRGAAPATPATHDRPPTAVLGVFEPAAAEGRRRGRQNKNWWRFSSPRPLPPPPSRCRSSSPPPLPRVLQVGSARPTTAARACCRPRPPPCGAWLPPADPRRVPRCVRAAELFARLREYARSGAETGGEGEARGSG